MKKHKYLNKAESRAQTVPLAFRSEKDTQLRELVRAANVGLVMAQQPYASFLASKRIWRELGRSIKPLRSPIALITCVRKPVWARDGACVGVRTVFGTRHVFDLCDTNGPSFPLLPTCERKEQFADDHGLELDYVSGAVTIVADSSSNP
jgi:hypothetical protein